jgi:hypothetical protein
VPHEEKQRKLRDKEGERRHNLNNLTQQEMKKTKLAGLPADSVHVSMLFIQRVLRPRFTQMLQVRRNLVDHPFSARAYNHTTKIGVSREREKRKNSSSWIACRQRSCIDAIDPDRTDTNAKSHHPGNEAFRRPKICRQDLGIPPDNENHSASRIGVGS